MRQEAFRVGGKMVMFCMRSRICKVLRTKLLLSTRAVRHQLQLLLKQCDRVRSMQDYGAHLEPRRWPRRVLPRRLRDHRLGRLLVHPVCRSLVDPLPRLPWLRFHLLRLKMRRRRPVRLYFGQMRLTKLCDKWALELMAKSIKHVLVYLVRLSHLNEFVKIMRARAFL